MAQKSRTAIRASHACKPWDCAARRQHGLTLGCVKDSCKGTTSQQTLRLEPSKNLPDCEMLLLVRPWQIVVPHHRETMRDDARIDNTVSRARVQRNAVASTSACVRGAERLPPSLSLPFPCGERGS